MRRQEWFVVGVVLIVVVSLFLAISASRRGESTSSPGGGGRTVFRARPGTMRENVQPIVSSTQERMNGTSEVGESAPGGAALPGGFTMHVSDALAERLRATPSAPPHVTIDIIEAYLADGPDPHEISQAHSTLAELYWRLDPPEIASAAAAIETAYATAQDAADRHAAAHAEGAALHQEDRPEEARAVLEAAREAENVATVPGLRLSVLEGTLAEIASDTEAAEVAYRRVLDHAVELDIEASHEIREAYRLAGLKLTRLLRRTGRTSDAEAISSGVASRLRE